MAISMYSASTPIFVRLLGNLSVWLDKAAAHAEAHKFDVSVLLTDRLYPDMLPFTRQVQIACDAAKGAAARLAGMEVPRWEDNETTIEQLKERIQRTIDFVKSVPAAQIDGSESRPITIPMRHGDPLQFDGETFLKHFALANFHFHCTTAYNILRHNGVPLGKADFLGR